MKPYAEACERNKRPILEVLIHEFADARRVLEIGSGTGQHAAFFGPALPRLICQTSDLAVNHAGIRAWLAEAAAPNVREPLLLDVLGPWPDWPFDAVFSANTAHIMSWRAVTAMFVQIGRRLPAGGRFVLYGPFSYGGRHTSPSNAEFDRMLRARDPASGVRDLEALQALADTSGLELRRDHAMPANNRLLVWERRPDPAE